MNERNDRSRRYKRPRNYPALVNGLHRGGRREWRGGKKEEEAEEEVETREFILGLLFMPLERRRWMVMKIA